MPRTPRRFSRPFVGATAALVACAAIVALLLNIAEREALWVPIGICSAFAALAMILAVRGLGFDWFSAPIVYLSYLYLFHFPLVVFGCLSPAMLGNLPAYFYRWTRVPSWYRAGLLALACAAAFAVGVSIIGKVADRPHTRLWKRDAALTVLGIAESILGASLVAVSIFQGGGSEVFGMAYIDLYASVFAGPFSYGVMIFTIGLSTTLAGVEKRYFPLLIVAQFLWACVMLLLGARSAALLGTLIAVTILAKRGVRVRRWVAVASIVIVLWVIAVVGVARQGAVRDGFAAATTATPVDALLEMGGSLYTVSLFDNWVASGDRLQFGGGYWLPFERAIGLVVPGLRSDLAMDSRAASEVLRLRTSGLGGSVVAEAYYNLGLLAPLLVFVPLGWLMAYLDRSARTPTSIAWLAVSFYPLLAEVRGWFLSVPAMIAMGAVPLLLIMLAKRAQASGETAASNPGSERYQC